MDVQETEKIVPQSSCEAETAALCAGCKVLVFIYNLLKELGATVKLPMQTHTDNDATRLSTINPGTTARTKHYELWMRYLQRAIPEAHDRHQLGPHQGADRRSIH